jgi:hypothetical protein
MSLFKIQYLLAIASSIFLGNAGYLNAQVSFSKGQSNAILPSQQMLLEMQQTNAPIVGGGSMQLFRLTQNNLSFAPLEGLDSFLNWRMPTNKVISNQTMGDRVERFKVQQRRQIVSDSHIFAVINRINKKY